MKNPITIAITGASSGIGRALALEYAAHGKLLLLFGRDERRLKEIASRCIQQGAKVQTHCVEVTNREAMAATLERLDRETPIDLMIANAGISAGTGGLHGETAQQVEWIFAVNVGGVLNSILPLVSSMQTRGRGQLALMSSLAGFRGLPSSPAYSASKALVRVYGEGLRGHLGHSGVEVSVICPGYIRTPMTDVNDFPMPGIMKAEKAAKIIRRGLEQNRSRIAFPLRLYLPVWLLTLLPAALTDSLFARLPGKPSMDAQRAEAGH